MQTGNKIPLVIIATQGILGVFVLFYILYIGGSILLPIIYAAILAILLNPLVNLLCRYGVSRVLAIFIAVLVMLLVIGGLVYFIIDQMSRFADTLPLIQQRFNTFLSQSSEWISRSFEIPKAKVDNWINDLKNREMNASGALVGQTLITLTTILKLVFLIPVYVFMFLFYKPLLLDFIGKLFRKERHEVVGEVLFESKMLIQKYLMGLLLEACIVATVNGIGLLIVGIDYAILIAIIGALLNMIPYVGGIIAALLAVLITFVTKSPGAAIYVLIQYMTVQFIDNHYIVPRIVASRVRINALMAIIAIFVAGAIWGIGGMFLSIPLVAIIKVVFDRVAPLKSWGFLLGDTMPPIGKIIFRSPRADKKEEEEKKEKEK
jgi:predicted PurR-regulated permease PerM